MPRRATQGSSPAKKTAEASAHHRSTSRWLFVTERQPKNPKIAPTVIKTFIARLAVLRAAGQHRHSACTREQMGSEGHVVQKRGLSNPTCERPHAGRNPTVAGGKADHGRELIQPQLGSRSTAFRPQKRASGNGRANFRTIFSDSPEGGWWIAFGLFGAVAAGGRLCGLQAALRLNRYGLAPTGEWLVACATPSRCAVRVEPGRCNSPRAHAPFRVAP